MNCIETKKNIETLLDGQLDPTQKEFVERHFVVCSDCRDLREQMLSLSSLLQVSRITPPSADLDKRVMKSFRKQRRLSQPWWSRIVSGTFVLPKPAFATLLILSLIGFWLAFQIGKISSSTVSMSSPEVIANPIQIPPETSIKTIMVEVPVIREKIVTRTVYVRAPKTDKNEKNQPSTENRRNSLPLYSSTVADNGYFTDVSLKGFQPSPEISAKIIKEVKEDEK